MINVNWIEAKQQKGEDVYSQFKPKKWTKKEEKRKREKFCEKNVVSFDGRMSK